MTFFKKSKQNGWRADLKKTRFETVISRMIGADMEHKGDILLIIHLNSNHPSLIGALMQAGPYQRDQKSQKRSDDL